MPNGSQYQGDGLCPFQDFISYEDFPVTASIFEEKEAGDLGKETSYNYFILYLIDIKYEIGNKYISTTQFILFWWYGYQ